MAATPSATTAQYAVPKRFGMAGILAITTLMAVLFGLLRSVGAPPFLYVFVGVLALVTCLVQMRYGEVPRVASMIAGAIVMPVCALGFVLMAILIDGISLDEMGTVVCMLPFFTVAGAGAGYLAGACTAGLFLLIDLAESYFEGGGGRLRYARPARPAPEYVIATVVERDSDAGEARALMAADNPFAPTRGFSEATTFSPLSAHIVEPPSEQSLDGPPRQD